MDKEQSRQFRGGLTAPMRRKGSSIMAKRKNVLLILSDQQRLDTVSAYGMNNICKTPHIDQLAAEGMKFTNAYTSSAICAPSRASVMTGLYAHKHGVIDNFTDIKEGTPLLGD